MWSMDRLSSYPFVVVRVSCPYCKRAGQYNLARLAAKFGPEIEMDRLLDKLALDCPWRSFPGQRGPGKYDPKCGACFPDLQGPPVPPDLPPGMSGLTLLQGGKKDEDAERVQRRKRAV